jgi:hypothetical protein
MMMMTMMMMNFDDEFLSLVNLRESCKLTSKLPGVVYGNKNNLS